MSQPAVIFGGPSLEHDVSILTGLQAARVLSPQNPVVLYWTETGTWHRVPADLESEAFLFGVPAGAKEVTLQLGRDPGFYETRHLGRRTRLDISATVICCHGGPGEDGRLQGLLDLAGVPYTGPDAVCASLTMDKLAFAAMMNYAGVPALPRVPWNSSSPDPGFPPPYIFKPRSGGSSIGVEVAANLTTARDLVKFHRTGVLEPYKEGAQDLYIGIRSYPERQLSLIESPRPASGQIYGYRQKYLEQQGAESRTSVIPAQVPAKTAESIRALAEGVADLTGLTGAGRLDFLFDGEALWVNELNSIPGALAFRLWAESGVTHQQLLEDMLGEAHGNRFRSLAPVDRQAAERKAQTLQIAGKISHKLAP